MIGNVFIGIDYNESTGEGYSGVVISGPDKPLFRKTFMTGDPEADFAEAVPFGIARAKEFGVAFMELSSLTHFVWDVPGWRYNEHNMLVRDDKQTR